jgi:hypothetical protein
MVFAILGVLPISKDAIMIVETVISATSLLVLKIEAFWVMNFVMEDNTTLKFVTRMVEIVPPVSIIPHPVIVICFLIVC